MSYMAHALVPAVAFIVSLNDDVSVDSWDSGNGLDTSPTAWKFWPTLG